MIIRFSASAWSTARIERSRLTNNGTIINGKITMSRKGNTGNVSGILSCSSALSGVVSFSSCSVDIFDSRWLAAGGRWPVVGGWLKQTANHQPPATGHQPQLIRKQGL